MTILACAANDAPFEPIAMSDPAFVSWACRVCIRLRNHAPGATDEVVLQALESEGIPSPEWAQAFAFFGSLAQLSKQRA
jgi:hypothetical protein